MIVFINAKLNLGLNIVRKRSDGYHDLETVFYPVGKHNGSPVNPEPFCDILELTPSAVTEFILTGRKVDCPLEKNLIYKAWKLFKDKYPALGEYRIHLEKHLPDGAGLGGGSADASAVLCALNELSGLPFTIEQMKEMALTLGADCPFFIFNSPCYAEGVGERLERVDLDLSGWWCLIVKPEVSISTKEAFAGVRPEELHVKLKEIINMDISDWKKNMKNDFEESLFPNHGILKELKDSILASGASYASMSGSGSAIFGLFGDKHAAEEAAKRFGSHYIAVCQL